MDVVPPLATSERDAALVDRAAAGAAFELVRRVELLLDHWGTHPPAVLRAGGLGVRDLRATAVHLHVEPALAGLIVETASAAGLLAPGSADDIDPGWLPTDAYDAWLARPVAERWTALATAWLGNPRLTGLVGGRDEADRPVNALSPELERVWLPATRRAVLDELADAEGVLAAGTGPASLLARLRWRSPRRPANRERAVGWALDEAAHLGVTGLGGVSSYARALLRGESPVPLLAPLLPSPVDHVLVQADLTAVAPGPLEADLARRLALLADVESRGGATVYRFGAGSVRRAFDAGWSATEIKDFLHASSRTPVPQSLDYLVDDVSRRFGTVRAGVAESFLRSDDETALTSLMHDPAAESLRLRRIAPTVVVSDVPLHVLLPRLRDIGAAPVVESADGTVQVARPDVFRSRSPPRTRWRRPRPGPSYRPHDRPRRRHPFRRPGGRDPARGTRGVLPRRRAHAAARRHRERRRGADRLRRQPRHPDRACGAPDARGGRPAGRARRPRRRGAAVRGPPDQRGPPGVRLSASRGSARTASAIPTSASTGPTTAQRVTPVIALPPIQPMPCPNQTPPMTARATPIQKRGLFMGGVYPAGEFPRYRGRWRIQWRTHPWMRQKTWIPWEFAPTRRLSR